MVLRETRGNCTSVGYFAYIRILMMSLAPKLSTFQIPETCFRLCFWARTQYNDLAHTLSALPPMPLTAEFTGGNHGRHSGTCQQLFTSTSRQDSASLSRTLSSWLSLQSVRDVPGISLSETLNQRDTSQELNTLVSTSTVQQLGGCS